MSPPSLRGGLPPREVEDIVLANSIRRRQGRHLLVAAKGRAKLYRASQYEELRVRPDSVRHLIFEWHESIGETLMYALGLPEQIVEAARDHDQPRSGLVIPKTLRDIVFVSNLLAGEMFEQSSTNPGEETVRQEIADDRYPALADEIEAEYQELLGALS